MNIRKFGSALITFITFSALVYVNLGCEECTGGYDTDRRQANWIVLDDMTLLYDTIHAMAIHDFQSSTSLFTEDYFLTESFDSWQLVRDGSSYSPVQDISYFASQHMLFDQTKWDSIHDHQSVAGIAAFDEESEITFKSFFVAYDTVTKNLDFFNYPSENSLGIELINSLNRNDNSDCTRDKWKTYLVTASDVSGFEAFESLSYLEHAMWSKGDPFLDQEKEWLIDSIFDKDMNYLGTQAYDCLYDNSFTFYPGNKLLLSLGTEYCTPLDDPLLDQGQDFVYQQYLVVDEPTQDNPYILITTPGALFAPQRMYVLDYSQESALLSTTYASDSIFMRVTAQ